MRVRKVAFITVKPALDADGQPKRVPMPKRFGLPHGSALPVAGWKVPDDPFIRRQIADGDLVLVPDPAAPAAKPASTQANTGSAA